MKEEIEFLKRELEKAKTELNIFYEISSAMRTTLKLEEILYIILTGVTCHHGLGFNRAALFLVDEDKKIIEGKMGIGPDTGEEAAKIWEEIEAKKLSLEDLIENFKTRRFRKSKWHNLICSIKLELSKSAGLIYEAILDRMPLHVKKEVLEEFSLDPLVKIFNGKEFVIVPLLARDRVNGVLCADNFVTQNPITFDQIKMLSMFANQAGLAIENSKLYESTLIQAKKDSLTSLWNHGYFQEKLQELLEEAKKKQFYLSLLMIDIDDFKKYNDTFGHLEGDKILKTLSHLLLIHSRKEDFIARYGGEEFCIILPSTDKFSAFQIAERLRKSIENFNFREKHTDSGWKLTTSIGLASFPQDAKNKEELILKADKALYRAKSEGKNKVCLYYEEV